MTADPKKLVALPDPPAELRPVYEAGRNAERAYIAHAILVEAERLLDRAKQDRRPDLAVTSGALRELAVQIHERRYPPHEGS